MGSVKSREGEISFQGCVAFPKTVTTSFRCGPNHSVTQTLTISSSEKGPGFMFSLVSVVPFSNVLTLSSTVLSVVWESFLHSETRGGQPSGPGHSSAQPNTTSSTSTAEENAPTLPANTESFFIVYEE